MDRESILRGLFRGYTCMKEDDEWCKLDCIDCMEKNFEEYENKIKEETIEEFRTVLLELLMNGYDYPSKEFEDVIYGFVNDACVDAKNKLKEKKK